MPDDDRFDELAKRLLGSGLAVPWTLLSSDHSALQVPTEMTLPTPGNLPSRMFRFPIETSLGNDGKRRFGLMHPRLGDHPFVKAVARVVGAIDMEGAPNVHGYTQTRDTLWWHAIDLMDAGHWKALLRTRQFTTTHRILHALVFALEHRNNLPGREVLAAMNIAEPHRDPALLRELLSKPSPCPNGDGKKAAIYWPINENYRPVEMDYGALAWLLIHGIEAGWFQWSRQAYLNWSLLGREIYAAGGKSARIYAEPSGQMAFAL